MDRCLSEDVCGYVYFFYILLLLNSISFTYNMKIVHFTCQCYSDYMALKKILKIIPFPHHILPSLAFDSIFATPQGLSAACRDIEHS